MGGVFYWPLVKKARRINFAIDFVPQGAIVWTNQSNSYEIGINFGAILNYLLSYNDGLFIRIGSGVQFIDLITTRQASGFEFGNYATIGYKRKLKIYEKEFYMDAFTGWRHVSNLDAKLPNGGIDNILIGLEFGFTFGK